MIGYPGARYTLIPPTANAGGTHLTGMLSFLPKFFLSMTQKIVVSKVIQPNLGQTDVR